MKNNSIENDTIKKTAMEEYSKSLDDFREVLEKAKATSQYGIPTLSQIEGCWEAHKKRVKSIEEQMVSDIINEFDESELIKAKKENT